MAGLRYTTYARGSDQPRLRPGDLGAPTGGGTANGIDVARFGGAPGTSIAYEGFLDVPEDGFYRFAIQTRAHADVYLNGAWMAGRLDDTLTGKDRQTGVDQYLRAGLHPIQIVLSHPQGRSNTPSFSLYWRQPGGPEKFSRDLAEVPTSAFRRAP